MAGLFDDDFSDMDDDGAGADFAMDDAMAALEADMAPEDISPRNNPRLLGHEDAEKMLLADYNAGRLPHALILAGPAGIGKATLAYRLARFLLAAGATQNNGLFGDAAPADSLYIAPENPVARRIAAQAHADLLTVERAYDEKQGRMKNDISVESARQVTPFLRKTAAEGGWRAVIVDSAEYLNANSQNALLKILEEPPPRTVLILTTAHPGGFLPTIRSRCRILHLHPLAEGVMSTLLDTYAPGIPAGDRAALARLAEGSIGKALQLHQDGGLSLYRDLLGMVESLPDLDIDKIYALAEKLGQRGAEQSFETACDILQTWCLRQARAAARGETLADILPGDAEIFSRLAAAYPPRHFFSAWEKLGLLFRQTDWYNLEKKQALVHAFLILQQPAYEALSA